MPDALPSTSVEANTVTIKENETGKWIWSYDFSDYLDSCPSWKVENNTLFKFVPNRHITVSNLVEWKQVLPKSQQKEII